MYIINTIIMQLHNHHLEQANTWPFIEAKRLLDRIQNKVPDKGYVLFAAGYGPSGLPHLGTFAEVLRTTLVRWAFSQLSPIPTKLICFSDDLDGLRKVPSNLPNPDMLTKYIGYPLTSVPDPFEQMKSYGHYMNHKLKQFLKCFKFDYELCSATEYYRSGKFDDMLLRSLERYEQIMNIVLPTLRDERRANYSIFMPVCSQSGKVLQVPILQVDKGKGTIVYRHPGGHEVETAVTGGKCKLQWKPDFAMRWAALGVDYEMYGKDHLSNGKIYSAICRILGGNPPVQLFYELFLNDEGDKISKSRSNSITVDQWLDCAPLESMSLFIYHNPTRAKKLHAVAIAKSVDEYLALNIKYHQIDNISEQVASPLYYVHRGQVPKLEFYGLTFNLLLNLVGVSNSRDRIVIWKFIKRYIPHADPQDAPYLDLLVSCAIKYYDTFMATQRSYLVPDEKQRKILKQIVSELGKFEEDVDSEVIQTSLYSIGMNNDFTDLRQYFSQLYRILLGQEEGPRLGSFIKLYTISKTIELINSKLDQGTH